LVSGVPQVMPSGMQGVSVLVGSGGAKGKRGPPRLAGRR